MSSRRKIEMEEMRLRPTKQQQNQRLLCPRVHGDPSPGQGWFTGRVEPCSEPPDFKTPAGRGKAEYEFTLLTLKHSYISPTTFARGRTFNVMMSTILLPPSLLFIFTQTGGHIRFLDSLSSTTYWLPINKTSCSAKDYFQCSVRLFPLLLGCVYLIFFFF